MTDIDRIMQQQPKKVKLWKKNVVAILLIGIFPLPIFLLLKNKKNNEK